jgi:hypothetical protein
MFGNVFAQTIGDSISSTLTNLRQFLDSCSRTADRIKLDFNILASNPPVLVISSNNRLQNRASYSLSSPGEIKNTVDTLENTLTQFYGEILPGGKQAAGFSIEKFGEALDEMERLLLATKDLYEDRARETFAKDTKFDYFITMEHALLLYWKARAIKQSMTFSAERFDESISSALQLYFEMSDKTIYQNDSVLEFRIAACLLLCDQFDLALQRYKKANAILVDDKTLPNDDEYRAIIPRQYAFVLWQQYDRICNNAVDIYKSPLRKQAAEIITEAYRVIEAAYTEVKRNHNEIFAKEPETEIGYVNNLLSYIVEHASLATRDGSLRQLNLNESEVRARYELLKSAPRNAGDLDTCACTAEFLLDPEVTELGERLKQGLDEPENAALYTERQLSRMRKTVSRILGEDHEDSSR